MSTIPMPIQDFFSLLLKSQADNAGNISPFFDDLRQQVHYRRIVLDTASTHSLYLFRRDVVKRDAVQLAQFNTVLDNLSVLEEEKIAIHIIVFRFHSYLFFTNLAVTEHLGYIVVPNNMEVE